MSGRLLNTIFYVAHQAVMMKNYICIKCCPIIDDFFSNYKSVALPYVSENGSGFREFILHPNNTVLHYYFKYNSSYSYENAIKFIETSKIATSDGMFKLIEVDEDLTVWVKPDPERS